MKKTSKAAYENCIFCYCGATVLSWTGHISLNTDVAYIKCIDCGKSEYDHIHEKKLKKRMKKLSTKD